jgi:hypothetical protein
MEENFQEMISNIPQEIKDKIEELNGWRIQRENRYGSLITQIEMIYDDIEAGHFGENAKNGSWYLFIKAIKEEIIKPDVESIKAELDTLIANEYGNN